MKSKKRLKRNLRILKKRKMDICFEMELSYEVIKERLRECAKMEEGFGCAVERAKVRKKFKKAVAKKLGVKYSIVKDWFPGDLNSTLVANFLGTYLSDFTHEEIRDVCQEVKLEFEEVYGVMI